MGPTNKSFLEEKSVVVHTTTLKGKGKGVLQE
jgi:hypothetical protein